VCAYAFGKNSLEKVNDMEGAGILEENILSATRRFPQIRKEESL